MSRFDSILVPLDGSERSAASIGCAIWLARRLNATLHVLSAGQPGLPVQEELRRLNVPQEHWSGLTLHTAAEVPEQAVLDAVQRYGVGLVVMTARGGAAEDAADDGDPLKVLGHVSRWIAERSPVPVLVLPPTYEERLPWTTALVPLSGEPDADEVLTVAVQLSNALGMEAIAVHVVCAGGDAAGLAAEARYADAPHHEYPSRLHALIERGLPGCEPGEAACLSDVVLSRGDIAEELLKLMDERGVDLLVIGWHGRFLGGHAAVVKTLLGRTACPVLLVKAAPPAPFRLKVGVELE